MARKDKYNKAKPQVSPITFVIIGVFFALLILAIVLSIPTAKEKFNSTYGLDKDNIYELTTLKKLDKEIKSEKNVLVIINNSSSETTTVTTLLPELQKAYNKEEGTIYNSEKNTVNEYIDEVLFLDLSDFTSLKDFFEEYEVSSTTNAFLIIAFKDGKLLAEYDESKNSGEIKPDTEVQRRNVRDYFFELTTEFKA
ncbi:MAG: hypothetical protein RBQ97_08735 [Acholeplasma sp.]|nr:hypothetical protein [Acholeplasma sp.]